MTSFSAIILEERGHCNTKKQAARSLGVKGCQMRSIWLYENATCGLLFLLLPLARGNWAAVVT